MKPSLVFFLLLKPKIFSGLLMNFNDITVLGNESPSSCVLHLQHSDKAINHYSCSFNYMPLVSGASLLLCKKKFSGYLLI